MLNPALTRRVTGWAAAGSVLLLAACTPTPPPTPAATTLASQNLPDFGHVHDVQVVRDDRSVLIATHTGVWTLGDPFASDPGPIERVGAGRQDTMAMTLAVDGTVYASGHPAPGEQPELEVPDLGLIRSSDGAVTWDQVSLTGEVDFHALSTASAGDGTVRVVGLDSGTSSVLVSDDAGETWSRGATVEARDVHLLDADPDTVVATTPTGLQLSRDGGRSFSPDRDAPALVLVDDERGGRLIGIDARGTFWTGTPGTESWDSHGTAPEGVQAMTYVPDDSPGNQPWVLVATDTGLFTSRDLGASWDPVLGADRG
ncbi:WD40/YVTN/BNR-like repeat-containing protein [Cellulosimicrobium funkei]|uniref:WD40/YVTN/BNR-like repeat-containing protein n=1 Tax=Cellulosimicrobium funkei TaxID=264251 RepID=UPI0037DC8F6B